ncbi:MAG: ferric reductase-like transmembrane domain-containing protein [archaeon]
MKAKQLFGWISIFVFSVFPVALLFLFPSYYARGTDFTSVTHRIGQVAGLIGMNLFALSFVLSTRLRFIEEIFDGLDKVYAVHAITGGLALISIMLHPIFLVLKFVPTSIKLAATYLLPGIHLSVNLGIIALSGMIILLSLTFFVKIKYQLWKFSHEFFGFFFLIAAFHIWLVKDTIAMDEIFIGYPVYAMSISIIGLTAFIYSLIIRPLSKRTLYKVDSVKLTGSVCEVIMVPTGKSISYKSGQFIFVTFYKISREPHPFSIASGSNNHKLTIVAKNLGDYTARLGILKKGDKVLIEGPYGKFNFVEGNDQVWLAGGIGITPFMGMAEDIHAKPETNVTLYYSVKKTSELVGIERFKEIQKKLPNFKIITKESDTQGFLNIEDIKKASSPLSSKVFLVCGPEGFKNSITTGLLNSGVIKKNIRLEDFNFR